MRVGSGSFLPRPLGQAWVARSLCNRLVSSSSGSDSDGNLLVDVLRLLVGRGALGFEVAHTFVQVDCL